MTLEKQKLDESRQKAEIAIALGKSKPTNRLVARIIICIWIFVAIAIAFWFVHLSK
ncbi:MAG: hypothetical protein MUD14_11120 [Hydrococcus sp. Prado102]|jgi:hypothetical protein|nr:hypothetical protein [Hydrococcus sp. Prado102]